MLGVYQMFRNRSPRPAAESPSTGAGGSGPPRMPPPRSTGGGGGGGEGAGGFVPDDAEKAASKGFRFKGFEDRMNADPQFLYKVIVEQIIGVGAAVLGDMSTRPNWGLNELDFVFSTLVVGSIMNFALMYLLAPTGAPPGTVSANPLMRLFDESTLTRMGAPGGHVFQPGYSLQGRIINLLFKGATFGLIGFAAGVFGTAMSNGLIALRKATDPSFVTQNESPNILLNAGAWTLHMGVSSNTRYQMLNGLDMALVGILPPAVFKLFVVLIRTMNNVVGGMSFVACARIVGSQKVKEAEPALGKK